MANSVPSAATRWEPLSPAAVVDLFGSASYRWWLSGGSAFDQWLGSPIRERRTTAVSTTLGAIPQLVAGLPEGLTAWVAVDDDDFVAWSEVGHDEDYGLMQIHDDGRDAWVLQVYVEDGTDERWVYRRDPRLQLPWDRAVLDIDAIPTGAPEVQLVWTSLRPTPEDEADKDAVLLTLSEEQRGWWERAILSIHPHSTWSIHVRSPFAPAKASWNRPRG